MCNLIYKITVFMLFFCLFFFYKLANNLFVKIPGENVKLWKINCGKKNRFIALLIYRNNSVKTPETNRFKWYSGAPRSGLHHKRGQKGGSPRCNEVKRIFISEEPSFNKHYKIFVAASHQPFIKLGHQVQKLRDESEIRPKVHICSWWITHLKIEVPWIAAFVPLPWQ